MEMHNASDNEMEIDLKELALELLSHWIWIATAMILAGTLGFVVSKFLMVPMYQSTSELYVLTKSTSITSLADIQTGTSLTNDYMVIVEERPVLEQVIDNLGLNETYQTLSGKISVANPTNSRILQITITDKDPERAKVIADETADVAAAFIEAKMKQDSPTITHYGYADGTPVSPNTLKNTVLAAMVGAIFVAAVVVIAYLFNDTLMTPEDVEKKLGINVLGSLPMEVSEYDGEDKIKKTKKSKKIKKDKNIKKGS